MVGIPVETVTVVAAVDHHPGAGRGSGRDVRTPWAPCTVRAADEPRRRHAGAVPPTLARAPGRWPRRPHAQTQIPMARSTLVTCQQRSTTDWGKYSASPARALRPMKLPAFPAALRHGARRLGPHRARRRRPRRSTSPRARLSAAHDAAVPSPRRTPAPRAPSVALWRCWSRSQWVVVGVCSVFCPEAAAMSGGASGAYLQGLPTARRPPSLPRDCGWAPAIAAAGGEKGEAGGGGAAGGRAGGAG